MSILDVGASTGGFTHCLLDAGAASAVCVDCGHDQLHPSIAEDERVVASLEGVNARTLSADQLPMPEFDLVVVDVSFISLRLVLPSLWPLLDASAASGRLIALVKPQFEAGKQAVSKGKGLVKDTAIQAKVLEDIVCFARTELPGCAVVGSLASPILGGDGQKEFLISLAHAAHGAALEPRGPFVTVGAAPAVVDAATAPNAEVNAAPAVMVTTDGNAAGPAEVDLPDDGLVPVTMSRPKTAAARSAQYAKKKEADSLLSGRERARMTDGGGGGGGRRGRKNKQHRQSD